MKRLMRKLRELTTMLENSRQVLSMNKRNLHYIYPSNRRCDFPVADNKLQTKALLEPLGVPVPRTYAVFRYFYELENLRETLSAHERFVIKPAGGSGGGGILVITARDGESWRSISGKVYTLYDLRRHISDIIFGVYSFDFGDCAVIESMVIQHEEMNRLSPFGLADVRVILYQDKPVMTMTRLPTRKSEGRANIHQGAVGAGIDLASGAITHAVHDGAPAQHHPDTGLCLIGARIPFWDEVKAMSVKIAQAVPLKYLGVDISIAREGPLLLEINVRPGLQIQVANMQGLATLLEQADRERAGRA